MQINSNNHSVYELQYHLVVITKYRRKVINEKIKEELIAIAKNIFENNYKCKVMEINTDKDHLHILFSTNPQIQLSKLINSFKTVSSRLIRKNNDEFLENFYWKPYF